MEMIQINDSDIETWKYVHGYEGIYQVSNLGRVRSVDRLLSDGRNRKGVMLKPYVDKDGYKHVTLTANSTSKHYFVHRLVAEAFIENPNGLPQINHKDETRDNNNVNNLEWCDARYNLVYGNHLSKISKKISGENHYAHKLTESDVRMIRERYVPFDKEFGQSAMARRYGVCQSVIRNIITRKIWKHV